MCYQKKPHNLNKYWINLKLDSPVIHEFLEIIGKFWGYICFGNACSNNSLLPQETEKTI